MVEEGYTGLVTGNVVAAQSPYTVTVQPTQKSQLPTMNSSFAPCFTAQLINNFLGSDDAAGVTVGLNAAALVGKQALGSLLPGPGWLYTATAVGWDGIQVGKAYAACTQ